MSHAKNFLWRQGHLRDLIPLLGDGLLTTDGAFHRTHRKLMLPAFHREQIAAATAVMRDEVDAALAELQPGTVVDLYDWTRRVALRVAMRALFGIDPDTARAGGLNAAAEFESALSFYGRDYLWQIPRGPYTPFWKLMRSRRRLDALVYGEIDRRRATGERGMDVLSLLLDASDEEGKLAGSPARARRGDDPAVRGTRHDHVDRRRSCSTSWPAIRRSLEDAGVTVDMILDETLRKYPPAYIGPRRAIETFEFEGATIPAGAHVEYCSWASHHLPDVWPEPEAFRPERFTEENKAKLPLGAYVPFGGGSRTCIGMRFGQAEVAIIARAILERYPARAAARPRAPHPARAHDLPARGPARPRPRARSRRQCCQQASAQPPDVPSPGAILTLRCRSPED